MVPARPISWRVRAVASARSAICRVERAGCVRPGGGHSVIARSGAGGAITDREDRGSLDSTEGAQVGRWAASGSSRCSDDAVPAEVWVAAPAPVRRRSPLPSRATWYRLGAGAAGPQLPGPSAPAATRPRSGAGRHSLHVLIVELIRRRRRGRPPPRQRIRRAGRRPRAGSLPVPRPPQTAVMAAAAVRSWLR